MWYLYCMPIYVETRIRGSLEEVWRRTQTPDLHAEWDLRFTSIEYLARPDPAEPQRFRYATRLAPGIEIAGWGETAGEQHADGSRTSALRFGSDDPRSLIREGSGYWKYEVQPDGVRFFTGYDYVVRWGAAGRVLDRVVFRPLIGWATAWSFDRLRLWIERGVEPRRIAAQAAIHALSAAAIAFVWIWHGLVPKLAGPHPDELQLAVEAGLPEPWAVPATQLAGALELGFGLLFPWVARARWPWWLTLALMVAATAGVILHSPHRLGGAFGPITVNLPMAVLAVIGLLARRDLPSAAHCLRRPPGRDHQEHRT